MAIIEVPGFLRFRAGEPVTPQLLGRRLTHLARSKEGTPVSRPVILRAGDQIAETESNLAKRRPLDLTITTAQLLDEVKMLQPALELQTELDALPWFDLGGGRRIMRNEVNVNLFRPVMRDYDFGGGKHPYLVEQIGSPKGGHKPVQAVPHLIALEFIVRLNDLTGRKFRLPTEAEYVQAWRSQSGELNEKKRALCGDLWTPCTTKLERGALVYRMVISLANRDLPENAHNHYKGIRLAEKLAG